MLLGGPFGVQGGAGGGANCHGPRLCEAPGPRYPKNPMRVYPGDPLAPQDGQRGESTPMSGGPPPFRAPSRAPPDHILSLRFKPGIGIAFGTSFGSTPRRHWTGRAFDGSRSPQQDKAGRADDARLKSGPVTRVRTRRVCCCKIMCLC